MRCFWLTVLFCLLIAVQIPAAFAQDEEAEDEKLSEGQLEQLVAPIALHPDSLLSQILMASTYPLEIVQAARWVEKNPKVTGDALEDAMEKEDWDASVKSLAAFPQVLQMMNDELEWTQQLGDAFLAQDKDVLAAVQRLRTKADKAGNLETTEQQTVETEVVTRESGTKETVYVIQPADPKVVYVPAYNPTVVYGGWAYPSYPPYYWYPPGYVAARAFWFGAGVVAGRALWGGCNWGRGNVNININRYNQFNRSNRNNRNWKHNPKHRRAVPYKGRKANNQFGKRNNRNAKSRENFRGRSDRGRRDLKRQGSRQGQGKKQRPGAKKRPAGGKKQANRKARPNKKTRPAAKKKQGNRKASGQKRRQPSANRKRSQPRSGQRQRQRSSAYRGAGRGGQTRQSSSRGRASRGGGGRGGGGRGGGGRRR
ncbi:MAG: DUF3300 domain-containing protein [Hyphomicrobiales bacterium]